MRLSRSDIRSVLLFLLAMVLMPVLASPAGMKLAVPSSIVALLVMYVAGKTAARRQSRQLDAVRRGRCPTCEYDLRFSRERCPECGNPIPHGQGYVRYLWYTRLEARALLEWCRWYYAEPHEYREIAAAEVTGADLAYLEEQQRRLESLGLHLIADVEDRTTRDHFPDGVTIFRIMLGADGAIAGVIWHCPATDARAVRLQTELDDGTLLVTEGILPGPDTPWVTPVPGIEYHGNRGVVDVPALVREHCETLHQRLAESSASFVQMSNLSDIIASQQRIETIRNAHKRSIGYIDEPELRAMCRGSLTEWHRDLLVQIEIQREVMDRDAGSCGGAAERAE